MHGCLPDSKTRQTTRPNKVCRLTPINRAWASTPPVGQWPVGWQLHTLMVRVLVLERAGEPLSVTTTGSRYWVRSLRVKVLLRAMMPAVLSKSKVKRGALFSILQKKKKNPENRLHCECWYFGGVQSWITSELSHVMWFKIQSKLTARPEKPCQIKFSLCTKVNLENLF